MASSLGGMLQIWQQAEVAELMPIDGYGGFKLQEGVYQIFSLDPEEDYEVNYHTIAGWKMLVRGKLVDYFACLETLRALGLVLAEGNGSVLTDRITSQEIQKLLAEQKG